MSGVDEHMARFLCSECASTDCEGDDWRTCASLLAIGEIWQNGTERIANRRVMSGVDELVTRILEGCIPEEDYAVLGLDAQRALTQLADLARGKEQDEQVSELQSATKNQATKYITEYIPWLHSKDKITHPRRVVLAYTKQLEDGKEQAEAELDAITEAVSATPWQGTPVEANVYHDDNRWCIHLWHGGVSHDIYIPLAAHKAVYGRSLSMEPICPTCGGPATLLQLRDGFFVAVCPDCWFDIVHRYHSGQLIEVKPEGEVTNA